MVPFAGKIWNPLLEECGAFSWRNVGPFSGALGSIMGITLLNILRMIEEALHGRSA